MQRPHGYLLGRCTQRPYIAEWKQVRQSQNGKLSPLTAHPLNVNRPSPYRGIEGVLTFNVNSLT